MRVICTYCSASKDPAAGLLPAWQRYQSARIAAVQRQAEQAGVPFCILSGEFGLLDWDQPIPWYDHLLVANEVRQLATVVARQLTEKGIANITYYTQSPEADAHLVPYLDTITAAAADAGVTLNIAMIDATGSLASQ